MSSIRRSVQVMELLARKGPLGVRAVAQQLKLPVGSVHRLLLDLEAEAVAERTADNEWELSYRLLEITGIQLDRVELPRLAGPIPLFRSAHGVSRRAALVGRCSRPAMSEVVRRAHADGCIAVEI